MENLLVGNKGAAQPRMDAANLSRVAASLSKGEVDSALSALHALDGTRREDPHVAYLFGVAYLQNNDGPAARAHLTRCRDALPHEADVHYHLGLAWLMGEARDVTNAADCFATALMYQADHFAAGYELAGVHEAQGEAAMALECYIRSANLAAEGERIDEAVIALDAALRLAPDAPELLVFMGRLLFAQGRYDYAGAAYAKALVLMPGNADLLNELGLVAYRQGREREAMKHYRAALQKRSIFPQAHNNLGNLHARYGRSREAVRHYGFAVAQLPGYSDAWYNLAREQLVLDDRDGARASLEQALVASPDAALARSTLAELLLADGCYTDGWRHFEARVAANTGQPYLADPRATARILPLPSSLDAAALAGKRILVLPEPSVGDELIFLRYLPQLLARGIDVDYAASAALRALLENSRGSIGSMRLESDDTARYAAVLASGDVPLLLGCTDDTPVPPPLAVAPLDDDVAELALMLEDLEPGPILALTWRAGLAADGIRRKSLALADVAQLAKVWPGPVLAVQREPEPGDLDTLRHESGRAIHDCCAMNDDLTKMAALLHVVDEYVGVSNTNMHLMTNLGNRTRVFVKHPGEWRWGVDAATTPWAPRARLYREQRHGGWSEAWRTLRKELAADYELLCD